MIPKVIIMHGVKLKANGVPWPVSRLEQVLAASLLGRAVLWPTAKDTNYWLGCFRRAISSSFSTISLSVLRLSIFSMESSFKGFKMPVKALVR